ncbi:membrane dipeptidase, partial [Candidatus Sumerlaeota bacterium]|nr:membrane dipeptidase [Candidatus Sumerlaeota bacterium]
MTLTCSHNTDWADSATDKPRHNGLTQFGRRVIAEMNRLGMMVDLSHCSEQTVQDALDVSESPVIFSHSATRALTDNPRNVSDDVLKRLSCRGDVVMIPFVPYFVSEKVYTHFLEADSERRRLAALFPNDQARVEEEMALWLSKHPPPRATLSDVADHIDHVREVAGIDHVGIGSDFDGFTGTTDGLEDVSCYPSLLAELLRRGYTHAEVKKVAGLNLLRVFSEAETVAKRLQHKIH